MPDMTLQTGEASAARGYILTQSGLNHDYTVLQIQSKSDHQTTLRKRTVVQSSRQRKDEKMVAAIID